jgi:hypothetical protein
MPDVRLAIGFSLPPMVDMPCSVGPGGYQYNFLGKNGNSQMKEAEVSFLIGKHPYTRFLYGWSGGGGLKLHRFNATGIPAYTSGL